MKYIRRYLRRSMVGGIVGAGIGLMFGAFLGASYGAHYWVTLEWTATMAVVGGTAGAMGGAVLSVFNWHLHRNALGERVCDKVSRLIGWRSIESVFWTTNGLILGGLVGIAIETIVKLRRIDAISGGVSVYPVEFSRVIVIAPVIGAVVGAILGVVFNPPKQVVFGQVTGLISGTFLGVCALIFWAGDVGSLMAAAYTVFVAAISEEMLMGSERNALVTEAIGWSPPALKSVARLSLQRTPTAVFAKRVASSVGLARRTESLWAGR